MSTPKASKSDLIEAIAAEADVRKDTAQVWLDAVLTKIGEMAAEKPLIIRGFGTFETKTRAARTGRNPQTGLPIDIPASTTLTFKAAKAKA